MPEADTLALLSLFGWKIFSLSSLTISCGFIDALSWDILLTVPSLLRAFYHEVCVKSFIKCVFSIVEMTPALGRHF